MGYSNGKVAGVLIFIAVTQFILGLVVSEALYPGYSISDNYVSDLGVGSSSMIFNSSVFLLGVLLIVGAYFLHRAFHFPMCTVTFALTGIGAMGVGIFTVDSLGVDPSSMIFNRPLHSVAGLFFFLFGGLTAIFAVVCSYVHGFKLMKMPFSAIAVILGLMELGGFFILFLGNVDFGLGIGGMQRMALYPMLLWIAGFGGYLMAHPDRPPP